MNETPDDVTEWLVRWRAGEAEAEAVLMARVYPTLRAIAARRLSHGVPLTLSATELANEAYLALRQQQGAPFANRNHYFAIAAHVIRRLVVDHLRERNAQKRGGDAIHVTLEAQRDLPAQEGNRVDALVIDSLLVALEQVDKRAARLVELRYFAGMTLDEASDALGLSIATLKRDWQFARAWLHERLAAQA